MKVTEFSVKQSTTVWVLIFVIFLGGMISYFSLPREAAPDIAIPIVIVSTPYFGVSPSDIERLVTDPMEKELKGLRNVKRMTSTSAESVSLVTVEFQPDVIIEDALQKVRDKVDKAKPELPPDAEDPEIIEVNASDWPVLIANVSGNMDPVRLKEFAEDMKDEIEKQPGVLRVDVAGGVEREIQILVDAPKIRYHGISLNQIIGKLQAENINLPGGNIDLGSMKYTVRVPGEFSNVADIEDIVIKAPDGVPVYLRDVAVVKDTFKERSTMSRLTTWSSEGVETLTQSNVSLAIVKRSGENIIDVAEASKKVIDAFGARAPEGIEILIINDMSEIIEAQVHDLENNIISGLILVFLTLLFFMGGARNALFVAVSVPLSMLISFLILSMLGITLNMVVLFSLILALGMLVDNAIVIVENIYRHASQGKSRAQAALDGTAEVGWAVVASTATTVAAFFPMVFWPGVTGEFMGYLPKTVIITLLSSLFVALVINPTLCATFMKVKPGASTDEREVPDNVVYRTYTNLLDWALKYRWLVVATSFAALIGTFVVFGGADLGVEFFPANTPDRFQVAIEMPDGTNLETTDELVNRVENSVGTKRELVEAWIGDSGVQAGQGFGGSGRAPHYGKVTVDLVDIEDQQSDPYAFMAELRKVFAKIPGATITLEIESMGPPAGAPVNIEIVGDDLKVLASLARVVKDEIRTIPGLIDLRDNVELARPEVHVTVDRERAAIAGVDTRSVAQTVRTAINGTEATVFRDGDDEYDVVVRLPEFERDSVEDLANLTVVNRDDLHIPITEVAHIGEQGGAGSIRHKNQERVVTVSANNADGFLAANLLLEVQKRVEKLPIPPGYSVRYTGENEDQDEAAGFLGGALLAALFLILLILVTEFNSLTQPVIILVSVILSLIGVLWSLMIFQMPFGIIMTGIGVISLAGVVVNNAIVMIDYANQIRRNDGVSYHEAVRTAALVRFRPVLLTATTTILGLMPLVVGVSIDFVNTSIVVGGRSVEMWGPMARVVTFGLMVATVLTLVVVPALYAIFGSIGERFEKLTKPTAAASALFLVALIPWTSYAQQEKAPETPEVVEEKEPTFDARPDAETELRVKNAMTTDMGAKRTLSLLQAQELLESENFDLKAARARVEVADARIRQAYSTVFPTLTAGGQFLVNQEEVVADFGQPTDLPAGTPEPDPIVIQPKTSWQWNLSASVRANFRALALVKGAYLQKEMSEVQIAAIRHGLETAVIESYYALLTIRSVMQISMEQVESAQTALNVAEKRKSAGAATDFEVTRANLRLVQAQKDVERSKLQFRQVRETVADLLNTEADFDVEIPLVRSEALDPIRVKQNALENRDSLRIARLNTELSQKYIDETYLKYLPVLGATFRLAQQKGTALSPSEPRWTLIFSAEWLLWDGGFREAELRQRKAEKLAIDFDRQKQERQSATEIDRTYADYLSAVNQLESGQNQLKLANEALRQAQTAYKYGVATQLDLINAEDQLKLAKLSNLQDRLAIELALTKLDHLSN